MKKILPQFILLFFIFSDAYSQAGMWTWVHGDSVPNSPGVFGVQGVPSPLNHPPALYEPCEWTDLQGNFWLFGGSTITNQFYGDLWKYDPIFNQWTWVKGTGQLGDPGNFGVKGIPSISNLPSARGLGVPTWVDLNGDFWLYGGHASNGDMSDLWRYNILSNTWTWIQGSTSPFQSPIYGTLGVPDSISNPGKRTECNTTWVDNNNNLWLFGGVYYNDLWQYNLLANEWTWMSGANYSGQVGNYGLKGVPDSTNIPGARVAYCHWKDSNGNFWFYGGGNAFPAERFNDVWRFNPLTNIWTWMSGTNISNDSGHYGIPCLSSIDNIPPSRFENRCFWTDQSGNFWMYGGIGGIPASKKFGDLWMFNPVTLEWTFVSGDMLSNQTGIYGTIGIPSTNNKPGCRYGAIGWFNILNNSLFIFGGALNWSDNGNDLWRYQIDPNCPSNQNNLPIINLQSSDTTFCEKNCINFFDLSTNNPTSWQWYFPGANPDTSTLQNPTSICYNTYGNYDVTLIACNANGCDSLHLTNFITCFQNPVDSIYQSNDTLYSLPAYGYQWYSTAGIINGAINQFYLITQPGSYYCVVTDSVGCEANSNVITITGLNVLSIVDFPL